jgi:hypothetical protein
MLQRRRTVRGGKYRQGFGDDKINSLIAAGRFGNA